MNISPIPMPYLFADLRPFHFALSTCCFGRSRMSTRHVSCLMVSATGHNRCSRIMLPYSTLGVYVCLCLFVHYRTGVLAGSVN